MFALACALGVACADPARDVPESAPPPPRDVLVRAREATASLARGRAPRDLDPLVQDLSADGRAPALRAAGALLAARWRLRRAPDDLHRAADYLRAAARGPVTPASCEALRARADLLAEAVDASAAGARDEHERACVPPAQRTPRGGPIPVGPVARSRLRRVVIDPGHGGSDPGAVGPTGLTEAEVNLDVARRVADRLATRYGVGVVLTRDEDAYVDLESRAAHANDARADLFVSIHCNAAPNREAHGVATFVLDTTSERVAARVARREGELVSDSPVGQWHVANILQGYRLTGMGRRSWSLAEGIQRAMLHDLRLLYPAVDDLGVHPAPFHVLVAARMPAVLVELSFISNAMEEQRMRAEGYRDVLAGAIARAVAGYAP